MSSFTGLFSTGGGGLKPKFQEFTSSGTFTPSQALIDAGGYIEVFLVGAGGRSGTTVYGSAGGETILTQMYLTSTSNVSVIIAGSTTGSGNNGGNSSFNGSTAGGINVLAKGGLASGEQNFSMGAGWGASRSNTNTMGQSAGTGVLGYGAGGEYEWTGNNVEGGIKAAKDNSGQGSRYDANGGHGYCLVKWYE